MLGDCDIRGDGVPKDSKEAAKWAGKLLEQGDPFGAGEHLMKLIRNQQHNTQIDTVVSQTNVAKVKELAEQGFADAQYRYGLIFENGSDGISQSNKNAFLWYSKAAAQGYAPAKMKLEKMCGKNNDFALNCKFRRLYTLSFDGDGYREREYVSCSKKVKLGRWYC